MNLVAIGQMIRSARKAAGLSQADLAQRAAVSRYTVVKLESGKADDVQLKTLAAILVEVNLGFEVRTASPSGLPILGDKK